jgi:Dolichyl-phosphate-mannose-protein mannosyltransferase
MPPPSTAAEPEVREAEARHEPVAPAPPQLLARLLARPEAATVAAAAGVILAGAFLLYRLVPDVSEKPLYDDEVLAGLTAVHPLGDLLDIVLWDRGGAPLHFLLAHVALALDSSAQTLRWLSVVFALATLPVCYDLGRRLGGRAAGVTAAVVVGTSSMLAVYGSFGRMYALFAFASAVAVDLFVRALERRTVSASTVAAVAAWFLPAIHPYGLVVIAIEGAVALVVWRGRPLRSALPVLAVAVAIVPFVLSDLRLSERFGVAASDGDGTIAPADFAFTQLGDALAAFAGGAGVTAVVFSALALFGLLVVARRRGAFAAFAVLALAAIPLLMVLIPAQQELVHQLSPRHLMFGLPVWAALVGAGVARLVRDLPRAAGALCLAGVAAAAILAPSGIADPRTDANATERVLAEPAAWVRSQVEDGSVLFFASPVFLAALPETEDAVAVTRSGRPLNLIERADYPVPSVMVALPLAGTRVSEDKLTAWLAEDGRFAVSREWLVIERAGPFREARDVLLAATGALDAAYRTTRERALPFRREIRAGIGTLCGALAELEETCPPGLPGRPRG